MRFIRQIIDNFRRFLAYVFIGCPICYSLRTTKINGQQRGCNNCHKIYDIRIWTYNE